MKKKTIVLQHFIPLLLFGLVELFANKVTEVNIMGHVLMVMIYVGGYFLIALLLDIDPPILLFIYDVKEVFYKDEIFYMYMLTKRGEYRRIFLLKPKIFFWRVLATRHGLSCGVRFNPDDFSEVVCGMIEDYYSKVRKRERQRVSMEKINGDIEKWDGIVERDSEARKVMVRNKKIEDVIGKTEV